MTSPPPPSRPQDSARDSRPRIELTKLLAMGNELVIEHQGQEYLLRLTSNGKLLLTK